jgi:hypothetical protein
MTVLAGMSVTVAVVIVIVMAITNRRTDHLIANKEGDGLPEVPEAALYRLTRLNPLREPAKHDKHKQGGNNLQHHELGELEGPNVRQHYVHRPMAVRIGQPARQIKAVGITDVMKNVFCFRHGCEHHAATPNLCDHDADRAGRLAPDPADCTDTVSTANASK